MSFVIFDLETTGLSPNYHEIIQIAGVRISSGAGRRAQAGEFSTYLRPTGAIPEIISEITGICDEHVADAPDAASGLAQFARFAGDATLVAHNGARFDMRFIRAACVRHGLAMREVEFVDTLTLARSLWGYGGPHHLDAIAARLGISTEGRCRHNALGDVQILASAFLRMIDRKTAADGTVILDTIKLEFPL
jgi:DNA polymerase III epsilon subunit family exonuclease